MDKNENLVVLCKTLQEEKEQLFEVIQTQQEQIRLLEMSANGDWVKSKIFIDAIDEAKKTNEELKKQLKEVKRIKIEYKKRLNELMKQY